MTSWKRLWGKKNKKSMRKIEQRYEQWLQDVQDQYGPLQVTPAITKEIKREKRFIHTATSNELN